MKCVKFNILFLFCCLAWSQTSAQDLLTKEDAVQKVIENNFGIKLSQNSVDIAKNNTSKFNTGQLPTVGVSGGYNYRLDNITANTQDGRTTKLSFAASQSANASIGANYVLFDGYFRKHNIAQLKERFKLSELELKATMENVAAQALTQYYQIAALNGNLTIVKEAIEISKRRLERAEQQFEFGQGSKLVILNAEVDLNNDSVSRIDAEIQIENAKRALNNLMMESVEFDYTVVEDVDFIDGLSKSDLKDAMLNENIAIYQLDKNIEIGNLSIDLANARKLPTVSSNVSYGYNYSKNNSASFLASQNSNGLNAGLSLSWNLFDGGTTRHALENARLLNNNLILQKEQLIENLSYQFEDAWTAYQNRLFIHRTYEKNLLINESNFQRTEEQFKIGQINSVDYRQAQLNLLNAKTAVNVSKFQVKSSEVALLLLSGRILE